MKLCSKYANSALFSNPDSRSSTATTASSESRYKTRSSLNTCPFYLNNSLPPQFPHSCLNIRTIHTLNSPCTCLYIDTAFFDLRGFQFVFSIFALHFSSFSIHPNSARSCHHTSHPLLQGVSCPNRV